MLEPSAGRRSSARTRAGMGVIVKEAVANGRLTARGDQPDFVAMAEQQDVAPDALALAFVLSRPWVDVALSGAATAEQLASNLRRAMSDGRRGSRREPRPWRSRLRRTGISAPRSRGTEPRRVREGGLMAAGGSVDFLRLLWKIDHTGGLDRGPG